MLVGANGQTLYEDHNRTTDDDQTLHAELGVVRWAVANLAPVHRIRATLYTSCEQCPMCAAAHAWAGLGRIVYATSCAQLTEWLTEWHAPTPPVAMLPVTTVAPRAVVDGPAPELEDEMKTLYETRCRR
jgi:tRNA(Arg) A34 adenosine deaminase TadA